MTDPDQQKQEKTGGKPLNKGYLKKGYDPRRWLKGRPKKPATMKAAEELLQHIIWDVLSEDIEHPVTHEKIDRLRAMIRSMTTSRMPADKKELLERIAGKVITPVSVETDGELKIVQIIEHDDSA